MDSLLLRGNRNMVIKFLKLKTAEFYKCLFHWYCYDLFSSFTDETNYLIGILIFNHFKVILYYGNKSQHSVLLFWEASGVYLVIFYLKVYPYVYKWNWPFVLCSVFSLSGFGIKVILDLGKNFGTFSTDQDPNIRQDIKIEQHSPYNLINFYIGFTSYELVKYISGCPWNISKI